MGRQRIAVIGGGAIAGVLAGAAHASGHEVTLCVRTPFERLRLETPEGAGEPPVAVVTDPARAPEVDWVLLTTKIQDAVGAAAWLWAFDTGHAPVVVVQNGVEHHDSAGGVRAPVLPALIYVNAERVAPGHVVLRSGTSMTVPEGELGSRFGELFSVEGFSVSQTGDFVTASWRKMLTNLAANPITALSLRRLDVLAEPDVRWLAQEVLAEGVAVARAEGASLTEEDARRTVEWHQGHAVPDKGTSMLYDRESGRPMEHEHITGVLVGTAERHGIDVPLNRALLALLRAVRPEG